MEFLIRDRTAFFAYAGLTEATIGFEQPVVALAFSDILLRRPVGRRRALRAIGYDFGPAGSRWIG